MLICVSVGIALCLGRWRGEASVFKKSSSGELHFSHSGAVSALAGVRPIVSVKNACVVVP